MKVFFFLFIFFSSVYPDVTVKAKRVGDTIEVWGTNSFTFDVTITLDTKTVHLKTDTPIPLTTTLQAKERRRILRFDIKKGKRFSYQSKYQWVLGDKDAKHDDTFVYRLPYETGTRHRIAQGYNGTFSHTGQSQYAIDFDMPKGTKVLAARDGIVVKVKEDSDVHGTKKSYLPKANQIIIEHSDGTVGVYNHLQKNGAIVEVGDIAKRGDLIGYSGNTGYTQGPHLHFIVYKAVDGKSRVSIPISFKTKRGIVHRLLKGDYYEAIQ